MSRDMFNNDLTQTDSFGTPRGNPVNQTATTEHNPANDEPEALELKEGADYVLVEGRQSVWITVGNVSVYIVRNDEGVSVDLYPLNDEMSDSLAGCWLSFADAEQAGVTR